MPSDNKVQGYVKPTIKLKIVKEVAACPSMSESKIVNAALELYYAQKEKTNSLSKNRY